jgi:putative hydrolase of the HAD superfamily
MIKNIIFDWGDTVMRDYPELSGPMFSWPHVELIPFIHKALIELKSKYNLIIATNAGESDTAAMTKALERVNVSGFFSLFYSSKDLGVSKPNPEFFIKICSLANIFPTETVMVGNDYNKDIISAKAAGLKTIFFNGKMVKGDFSNADIIIYSMDHLLKSIDQIH